MICRSLLTLTLLTNCASSGHSSLPAASFVKSGIFETGEYAHFTTSDGGTFELRVLNAPDRERLHALAPITPETTEPQCLSLRVAGTLNGEETDLGRPIFVVSRVIKAVAIGCKGDVR